MKYELGTYSLRLFDQSMPNRNGYTLKMEINGKPCMMKLDTPARFLNGEQKCLL